MDLSKRILVADDERGIRRLLSDVLANNGFQVSLAMDGQECLDKLAEARFDLVITDIVMPKLDGIEVLKWMKKSGREEKIIVMTGNSSSLDLPEQDIPPVLGKLEKPFTMDSLLETVLFATSVSDRGLGQTALS